MKKKYTICQGFIQESKWQNYVNSIYQKMKKIKNLFFLFVPIFMFYSQEFSAQTTAKNYIDREVIASSNTWAVGAGFSNFIMHGDLRSIGTGDLGDFWNFGGYAYVDKMFNSILGLEFKLNYNKISGGAQYFSDIYDVLYVNNTQITNNLFFEGRAYGAELNMIFSFSNLIKRKISNWHMAGYFGVGYHQYNSTLFQQNSDGSRTELVDFGSNPARNSVNEASSIYISAQFGIKYRLNKKIDIEFRPSWYFNYEDHLDATISNKQNWETFFVTHVGLTFKLGKKKIYTIWGGNDKTSDAIPFTIQDTDKDGVMDKLDIEPNTPKGVKVYGNGEAMDSDNDGLPDYKDECPLKPGPISNKGCPTLKDSDNDGLMDDKDLCPLQAGSVENKGCPIVKNRNDATIIKYISGLAANIYFDTGKFYLKEDSKKVLDQIAKHMLELPEINFKVEGHTDNRDLDKNNLYLSQKRADVVLKYLMRKKVKKSRLAAKGYGETRPMYSNNTPQGRQLNRRVEIRLLNSISQEIDLRNINDKNTNTNKNQHIVIKNETLFSIAKENSISIKELKKLNNLNSNKIYVGQKLKIKE